MSGQELVVRQRQLVDRIRGDEFKQQVAAALPPNVTPERFLRIAVTAALTTPDLAELDHGSILTAMVKAAADGLLPDGREAAFTPRKGKAVYVPMIGGFRKIAAEHGWTLITDVVYENDGFDQATVDGEQKITHRKPRPGEPRGELIAAYAIAKHTDGRVIMRVLDPSDVARHRKSASTDKVWNEHPAAMWEKSAGRELFKQLPLADDDRVDRVLRAGELDPAESAAAAYGPLATRTPPKAEAAASQSDGTNGVQSASAASAASPDEVEAEATEVDDEEPGAGEPAAETLEQAVAAAEAAGKVEIPNGKFQGKTLAERAEIGGADSWFEWMLQRPDHPVHAAVRDYARVHYPELWEKYAPLDQREAA